MRALDDLAEELASLTRGIRLPLHQRGQDSVAEEGEQVCMLVVTGRGQIRHMGMLRSTPTPAHQASAGMMGASYEVRPRRPRTTRERSEARPGEASPSAAPKC